MSPDGEIGTFVAGDGYAWKYRRYAAAGAAHVVCLHGIQSHGGWYTRSCRELAGAGYDVHFLDRRGSGLNDRARGDAPSFHRLLADIDEYVAALRAAAPAAPIFLLAI